MQCKGSIYHIKDNGHTTFTMGVDLPEIGRIMEVSIMFDICTYCFLLCTTHMARRRPISTTEKWKQFMTRQKESYN